eukprot:4116644-Pyramimonas_sp.AAC.1
MFYILQWKSLHGWGGGAGGGGATRAQSGKESGQNAQAVTPSRAQGAAPRRGACDQVCDRVCDRFIQGWPIRIRSIIRHA